MRLLQFFSFTLTLILLWSCSNAPKQQFSLVPASKSGIDFSNEIHSTPELNILNYIYYYNGAGVAVADFNNDDLLDLYFTANQSEDALFLNKGHLKFENITELAQISNGDGWTNGVSTVDINGDGYMDIYLSKVGNYHSMQGTNKLYINQGPDANGIPTFKEQAAQYGLNFKGFSTQASFFDFDLDGDLDMYLLNHSTNPNQNYGKGTIRNIPNQESGDKLYENIGGKFIDVSEQAGIFQSKFGYGLGVSISDLNNDGYPDIYVSNDFFENDYLYLNNGDKTFTEQIHASNNTIGHTTHYSMGNDIHDINNDGYPDIISVDMLPEDPETYKTSGTEFNYQIYQNYIRNGYAYQYMQNALQLNNGNGTFSEIGNMSGITATEWSWCPLIADFDNDGLNDIYITNGILGATNDMDFINFIANDNIQKSLGQNMTEKEMIFIDKIPVKKTPNYFFKNQNGQTFSDVTKTWLDKIPSFSNGAAYADLDNDGDLDLVVNNVNEKAFLLQNNTAELTPTKSFIKFQFQGNASNTKGIGTKVTIYQNDQTLVKENYTSRGYLSSVAPELLFGLGDVKTIDSIKVLWPDGSYQNLKNTSVNQTLILKQAEASQPTSGHHSATTPLLESTNLNIPYRHVENSNIEFNRDALLPFALGNEGPAMAIGDLNNDGLDDLFLGNAKGTPDTCYLQQMNGEFLSVQEDLWAASLMTDDTDAVIADFNNDGWKDLLVVSGGNEFTSGPELQPRLYWNKNGTLEMDNTAFKDITINASKVSAVDWDNDGDLDIALLSNLVPHKFGVTPTNYLFTNDGNGQFLDVTNTLSADFQTIGNTNDIAWADVNGDDRLDFIVTGDWMPIQVFIQTASGFELQKNNGLDTLNGFWNTLKVGDFDQDGDIDIIAGNWGLNTRLKASTNEPISLYSKDFDGNGKDETLITYFYKGKETTLASKEELVKQMPMINKKYLSFKDFARASVSEIFGEEKLEAALQKKVFELGSCYFENTGNNNFKKILLPFEAQVSSINDIAVNDFDGDGTIDFFLVGNNFEISTQLGRLDAQYGTLLLNEGNNQFTAKKNEVLSIPGASRKIKSMTHNGVTIWLVARNNDTPIAFKKLNHNL